LVPDIDVLQLKNVVVGWWRSGALAYLVHSLIMYVTSVALDSSSFLLKYHSVTMAPTIFVVGATGNTGRSVVETLSKLLNTDKSGALAGHRILALTRSASSLVAKQFTGLPGVEVLEKNWVEITDNWLREQEVPSGRPPLWSYCCQ
jgi:hypothetical protein